LWQFEQFTTKAEGKKNLVRAIESVSQRLGNTPAVCRKCYIHPQVIEAYLNGETLGAAKERLDHEIAEHANTLRQEEQTLVDLLQQRMLLEKAG
jgi:DNA topoisomerase-1